MCGQVVDHRLQRRREPLARIGVELDFAIGRRTPLCSGELVVNLCIAVAESSGRLRGRLMSERGKSGKQKG